MGSFTAPTVTGPRYPEEAIEVVELGRGQAHSSANVLVVPRTVRAGDDKISLAVPVNDFRSPVFHATEIAIESLDVKQVGASSVVVVV
jgi:hypothetical protein